MTLNKAQKLVTLVELLKRRGSVRADELMATLELEPRSLRRYLADLRDMEVPLRDHGVGDDRTIELDPDYRRVGLRLPVSELLALELGRDVVALLGDTPFANDLGEALHRLGRGLSEPELERLAALRRRFHAISGRGARGVVSAEVIDELVTALLYDNPVRAATADGVERLVEPYTLVAWQEALFLVGRDADEGALCVLPLAQLVRLERVRTLHFRLPRSYDPARVAREVFVVEAPASAAVCAELPERQAGRIRGAEREPLAGGQARVRFRVPAPPALLAWLAGLGRELAAE